jgi:hypothetical protein
VSVDRPHENQMDLIFPFDSDDPEFVRGFEIGALWERLKGGIPCAATLHAVNAEMVIRLAEASAVSFSAEDLSDDWIQVEFH